MITFGKTWKYSQGQCNLHKSYVGYVSYKNITYIKVQK